MKSIRMNVKTVLTSLFFIFSFSTFASDLPDPEALAKQYLKDLCTLNEQDFTRKYMLTQGDAVDLINARAATGGHDLYEELSDTLIIISKIQKKILKSYRSFKEWQSYNHIDSSKLKYHSCDFELEKNRELPFYGIDDMAIYFSYDTSNYALMCDDFVFIKSKWIAGDFNGIVKTDKNFNQIYDEYVYNYDEASVGPADSTAMVEAVYEEGTYVEEEYVEVPMTKKQSKIQKKIDAYYSKINALSNKYYE